MKRQVITTKKDDGVITELCNPGESWSPVTSDRAIFQIELDLHQYFVKVGTDEVDIHVVDSEDGKYLRTDPDKTERNNLLELPDC